MYQYQSFIHHFLNQGCSIDVYCEDENMVSEATTYQEVHEEIDQVDVCNLYIYLKQHHIASAYLVLSNDKEEWLSDYSANKATQQWEKTL